MSKRDKARAWSLSKLSQERFDEILSSCEFDRESYNTMKTLLDYLYDMYGIPLAIHEIIARYVADICVDAEFFTKFNSMIHKIRPQILCPFEFNLKIVRAAVYDTRGPAVRRYNIPLGCMMPYKQFGIETNNLMLVGNDKIFRFILLQHKIHCFYVIFCMTPIPLC